MTEISRQFFSLKHDKRLKIFHMDGRTYLNNNSKKYDVIIIDAFNGNIKPFHLMTKEAVKKMFDSLNREGIVIINTVSSLDGKSSSLSKSEYLTYKSIFPSVLTFAVKDKDDREKIQNIIFIAMKNKNYTLPKPKDTNLELKEYLSRLTNINVKDGLILTDNYAPVENMFIR
ncbi:fused MFS/spermidine synthase [Candidatus Roizmanbacteria bacterium]|nr:fused MFS/spermidine synthase [Candidatus Roizmanbacteria bacterium]